MEKAPEHNALIKRIEPPVESHITTVLNGVGNGMMVGSVPFVGMKLYADVIGHNLSKKQNYFGAFATATGILIGAVLGRIEGKRLLEYRQEVNDEIVKLRGEVDAQAETIASWEKKINQPKPELVLSDGKSR